MKPTESSVKAVPRNAGAMPITEVNVPPIAVAPRAGDATTIGGSWVSEPY
ncbi:MAG TPA: hypothetical protein VFG03_16995 [Telluria sp.]|nr:hypothetical protein [Telluria sp.]